MLCVCLCSRLHGNTLALHALPGLRDYVPRVHHAALHSQQHTAGTVNVLSCLQGLCAAPLVSSYILRCLFSQACCSRLLQSVDCLRPRCHALIESVLEKPLLFCPLVFAPGTSASTVVPVHSGQLPVRGVSAVADRETGHGALICFERDNEAKLSVITSQTELTLFSV